MMFGFIVAFITYSYLIEIIQNIFRWTTDNRIQFSGKYFILLTSDYFFLSIGIGFFLVTFDNVKRKSSQVIVNSLVAISLFCLSVFSVSALDANFRVIQCTACRDGIIELQKSAVNYDLIVILSVSVAVIPSLIRIIRIFIKL